MRVTRKIAGQHGLLDPFEAFAVEGEDTVDRLGGGQRLVVVHHDGDIGADGRPDGADHPQVLGDAGIADFGLDAAKAPLRPVLGGAGGFDFAFVTDCAIGGHGFFDATQKTRERSVMEARERVPKRHVDSRQRHRDEPLRTEETEAPLEFGGDLDGRELVAGNQRLDVADEVGGRPQGGGAIRERDAAADNSGFGDGVRQDERGFGDGSAGGAVRLHGNAHGADLQRAESGRLTRHHER